MPRSPTLNLAEASVTSPRVAAVNGTLPANRYDQAELTEAVIDWAALSTRKQALLRQVHTNSGVRSRHLALPLENYAKLRGLGQANDAYLAAAVDLAHQSLDRALTAAGLAPTDIDLIVCASTTGIAVPSLDARLANRMGFRADVRRLPLFGLGCVAGAAGLARLRDYLAPRPDQVAVLVAVELCSLTIQLDDDSTPALIGSALFGDGAAAVVLVGADRAIGPDHEQAAGPLVIASRSRWYPDTEHLMGWQVTDSGLSVVLGSGIPTVIREHLGADVDQFLADLGLRRSDINHWVCHPGGPKVLRAIEETLDLPPGATDLTWRSLAAIGNISSASVLHVLSDTNRRRPAPGSLGLLLAVGPGFSGELVLLRW